MDYDVMEARHVRDVEYFKKFTVHPECPTVVWPNGAGFAILAPPRCATTARFAID